MRLDRVFAEEGRDGDSALEEPVASTSSTCRFWAQSGPRRVAERALLHRRLDIELYEFLYGTGRFSCPYGRASKCPGQVPTCSSGLRDLSRLPATGTCVVRRTLEEAGWSI